MIVCTKCGHRNKDGEDFCGSCGAFLEFHGERVEQEKAEPEPESVAQPVEPVTGQPAGFVQRVRTAVGLDEREGGEHGGGAVPNDATARADEQARRTEEDAERQRREAEERGERERREAEEQARREADERAQREAEEAERQRRFAEESQRRQREAEERRRAEERARQEAEEAEEAEERARAEEQARQEAEEAERQRRAAALLARPSPTGTEQPATAADATPTAPAADAPPSTGHGEVAESTSAEGDAPSLDGEPTTPTAVQPTAATATRQPGRTRRRPTAPAKVRPEEKVRPGDVICGDCGTGNDPERNFCRKCGDPLAQGEIATEQVPWYKRIFRRRQKKMTLEEARAQQTKAGGKSGPSGVRRGKGKFKRVLGTMSRFVVVLGLLGALGLGIGPWRNRVVDAGQGAWQWVQRKINPEFVNVTLAGAAVEGPGALNEATAAIDRNRNSFLALSNNGSDVPIVIGFEQPVDIARIGFILGDHSAPDNFVAHPRPRQVIVTLVDEDGRVSTTDITVDDTMEFQDHGVEADAVVRAEVEIRSVYPPVESDSTQVQVAEIEFFRLK